MKHLRTVEQVNLGAARGEVVQGATLYDDYFSIELGNTTRLTFKPGSPKAKFSTTDHLSRITGRRLMGVEARLLSPTTGVLYLCTDGGVLVVDIAGLEAGYCGLDVTLNQSYLGSGE